MRLIPRYEDVISIEPANQNWVSEPIPIIAFRDKDSTSDFVFPRRLSYPSCSEYVVFFPS